MDPDPSVGSRSVISSPEPTLIIYKPMNMEIKWEYLEYNNSTSKNYFTLRSEHTRLLLFPKARIQIR